MPSVGKILREPISVRAATKEDLPQMKAWLEARKGRNQFDEADFEISELGMCGSAHQRPDARVFASAVSRDAGIGCGQS